MLFPSMPLCTDNAAMIACSGREMGSRGAHLTRHRGRSATKVDPVSTVLVTGAPGSSVRSHLADRLLAEGHRVISVDDLSTGRIANLVDARGYGKEFTFFNMDVRADGLLPLFERHLLEVGLPPRRAVGGFALARRSHARRVDQRDGHAERAGVRREGRDAQGRLRGERRHDLRGAAAPPAGEGDQRPARTPQSLRDSKKVVLDYLGFYQRYRGLEHTALASAIASMGRARIPMGKQAWWRSSRRGCSPASQSRSSATATRRATTSSSTTSCMRSSRPRTAVRASS